MKLALILLTASLISSCGVVEKLDKNCGSDLNEFCNMTFGTREDDQDATIKDIINKNDEQDAKILALETQNEQLIESMTSFSEQIDQLSDDDLTNKNYLIGLINSLQTTVNANLVTLTNLDSSLNYSVTGMIDVCGDHLGHFDEIILKTKSGKYIAYFEQGSKRFLSELSPGNYQTTDNQACNFTVTTNGISHVVNGISRID